MKGSSTARASWMCCPQQEEREGTGQPLHCAPLSTFPLTQLSCKPQSYMCRLFQEQHVVRFLPGASKPEGLCGSKCVAQERRRLSPASPLGRPGTRSELMQRHLWCFSPARTRIALDWRRSACAGCAVMAMAAQF